MRDGKQTSEAIPIPLRRTPSSSSTIPASTYSHRTSNDEDSAPSIFSRSPTNSTCTSTINSSSTKEETTSSRSRLQLPQPAERKRRSSFRETASQLIASSSSSFRGRSPPSPKAKPPSPTTSTGSGKTARRSRSSERPAHQNVHTYAGRHSDQWLFGNFSVTGSIKKMIEKKDRKWNGVLLGGKWWWCYFSENIWSLRRIYHW